MSSGIDYLLEEGIISEVLGRLQSGKEAEVFIVQYGDRVVAAKVYKDRGQRSFKNNSGYKEGRAVRNSRSQRAMERGSSFGKAASEEAWKSAEVEALYTLHRAGVRVPTPVMFIEGVLMMELVLGEDGGAAPRIIDTRLEPAQANAAYYDMLGQLVKILSCDLIHGDLSPYNVLWGVSGPTIIDFPQIISASHNTRAEMYFLRDARNILGHFVEADPALKERFGDAEEIWRTYARRELTPDFVPQGRARPIPPRPPPPRQVTQPPSRGGLPSSRPDRSPPRHGVAPGARTPHVPEVIVRTHRSAGHPQPPPQPSPPHPQSRPTPPPQQRSGPPQQQRSRPQPQQQRSGPPAQQQRSGPRPPQQRTGPPPQQQRSGPPPQQQQRSGPPPQQQRSGPPHRHQRPGPPPQQQRSGPPPPQQQRSGPPPQQPSAPSQQAPRDDRATPPGAHRRGKHR